MVQLGIYPQDLAGDGKEDGADRRAAAYRGEMSKLPRDGANDNAFELDVKEVRLMRNGTPVDERPISYPGIWII